MKRYDASRMVRFVATKEQKQWLLSQTHEMKSLSQVMRELVQEAMLLRRDGIPPTTKR